ncbi:hypothetical protein KKG58_01980 [Patescibacteria group bacterium]|nr:hypothetical protein [Patescibacteria group bacterium]
MKIKRQHIFLVIFILLIGVIVFIIFKNTGILGLKGSSDSGYGIAKPDYLMIPIPKINKIKTVVDNPKFKEMKYIKEFFEPVEVELTGKANPFFPFRPDKDIEIEE